MAAKMRDTVHDALMKQPEGEEELQLPGGATSLDLLRAVYRDAAQPYTGGCMPLAQHSCSNIRSLRWR